MTTTTINHPDFRPGRGERATDRGITLHNEASDAMSVWTMIYSNREQGLDPRDNLNADALAQLTGAGDLRAELVALAIADADTAPLQPETWTPANAAACDAARLARYNAAAKLRDHKQAVAPAVAVPVEQDDVCSHGVAFTATCGACDAEF